MTNYADPDIKDPGAAYYGSHLERLIDIKRDYDPNNFFRYSQSIPTPV